MKAKLVMSFLAAVALACAVPAMACDGHSKTSASATTASAHGTCSMHSTAWAGAWLQRTSTGLLAVAAVAEGSPAAHSGLRAGDIVLTVNGRDMTAAASGGTCSGAACTVGSTMAWTVQRGHSTKNVKLKLEKMPASATERFAARDAEFDPTLGAVVIPVVD